MTEPNAVMGRGPYFLHVAQAQPATKKIDLNEAFGLLAEIGQWVEVCTTSQVQQLVILRDTFMRTAYATNRPHRRTRPPKPTTKKELV